MYSLDINFLKDRPDYQPKAARGVKRSATSKVATPRGALIPLYGGVALGLFIPALLGGLWFLAQQQNASLNEELTAKKAELGRLVSAEEEITALTAQATSVKEETNALGNVFNKIRPWSAILQDVRDRVPSGVQVRTIQQSSQVLAPAPTASPAPTPNPNEPPPTAALPIDKLTIEGTANSFEDVNDFVLLLQQSSFVKPQETQLLNASLADNPLTIAGGEGKSYKLPQVVDFKIQTTLNDLPAAVLVQELERKGAVGLASRIRNLQSKGVIQ
jgi:type IV pilus assembly protein PilN